MYLILISAVGATLACGTGACAVVVAAVLEGRAERVRLKMLSLGCVILYARYTPRQMHLV